MPRRKPGTLLPIEEAVLEAAVTQRRAGVPEFHGFAIASSIQEHEAARRLTAHGTLYRALARMETAGLLASRWEDPELAEAEGRPRRRLYELTGLGESALREARTRGASVSGTAVSGRRLATP